MGLMAEEVANNQSPVSEVDLREKFDFWKVVAISSLAVATVNLGLLYFLTMEVRTIILSDAAVFNTHPTYVLTQPISSGSALPDVSPTPSLTR